jgi:hypothetical protein
MEDPPDVVGIGAAGRLGIEGTPTRPAGRADVPAVLCPRFDGIGAKLA